MIGKEDLISAIALNSSFFLNCALSASHCGNTGYVISEGWCGTPGTVYRCDCRAADETRTDR
jgi:hypothetical protein